VSSADGGPADHELDSILRLDDPGARALLFLWPEAQHIEGRESYVRGIIECSDGPFAVHGNKEGLFSLFF
jgi:hypothetical protein